MRHVSQAWLGTERTAETACRLSVFVGEGDNWRGQGPVHAEVVQRAHQAGLAGISVFRCWQSFGTWARGEIPQRPGRETSVMIVIVDAPARIQAFLPVLDDIVSSGLAIIEDVQAVRRAAGPEPGLRRRRWRPGMLRLTIARGQPMTRHTDR